MTNTLEEKAGIPELTGSEKKKLRGLAQLLQPRLQVGKQGITPEVIKELELAFKKEDLVKVRYNADRGTIMKYDERLAEATGSLCICNVGKTSAFFRQRKNSDGEQ